MFEEETFENIMERMLSGISDDIDKRETSPIWSCFAPAAAELAQAYISMGALYNIIFGDTEGDLLERRVNDFGVEKKEATTAIRKGVFHDENGNPFDIPEGSRFFIDDHYFIVRERLDAGQFTLESETAGAVGNDPTGALLSLGNIPGLAKAELLDILVPGLDTQTDESLKIEMEEKVSETTASGNEYEYKVWAKEITGVHSARVYSQWDGPNTVKVVLMDAEGRSPSPLVIQQTWDHIESVRPVGAIVTVVGVTERVIGVTTTLTLQTDADLETVKLSISNNTIKYFSSIAGKENTVRFTAIGNAMLDGTGVVDYSDLLVDGATSNIVLNTDDVPVLGTLTLN